MRFLVAALLVTAVTTVHADDAKNTSINLHRVIDFKGCENASLKDLIEYMSDRYELDFVLDTKAFKRAGVPDVGDTQITLPPRGGQVLREFIADVCREFGAVYFIREDGHLVVRPGGPSS